jgi:hypothetical protein
MSDKVYIVTSGSYSDYGINAVFLDEAAATAYAAKRDVAAGGYGEFGVEEWDVATEATFSGYVLEATWRIPAASHFNSGKEESWTLRTWHDGEDPGPATVIEARVDSDGRPTVRVRGTSQDHVTKSLQDASARLKAEIAGLV